MLPQLKGFSSIGLQEIKDSKATKHSNIKDGDLGILMEYVCNHISTLQWTASPFRQSTCHLDRLTGSFSYS